jgi:cystathionine beta-synthase
MGRKIRERCPSCLIVGVDPEGSVVAEPESINRSATTSFEVATGQDHI